jgi:hypothetical protein
MTIENSEFSGVTIDVDDRKYLNCNFINCTLRYSGGIPPTFIGCTLDETGFSFSGAAGNTIELLRAMYHGGFKIVANAAIQHIQTPKNDV